MLGSLVTDYRAKVLLCPVPGRFQCSQGSRARGVPALPGILSHHPNGLSPCHRHCPPNPSQLHHILRQEAPLIHEIEVRMNQGLEAERNLTAVREEIRRELVEAESSGRVGDAQRAQMENRIWQLDKRLSQLRQKNLEVERRFRYVIGGIRSGTIRSRRKARSMLGGIVQFYTNVVMSYVNTSVSLAVGIVRFWTGLFGKLTGMAGGSSARLFEMPHVEVRPNLDAGF
ncbi:uncharacterized protein LOC142558429 [Dermacentor variabilis]|uniref:uncharacterized protein LOC142558429 n=1 Tax=Dermacentor variabilis TaxID=34621 RepID=UPI003F5BC69D